MCVWDVPVRLTFILTWRNALLLFRICNLCYYGRVVHGNEMLCTFGYRFFFSCYSSANITKTYYSPPAVHRLERPRCAALKSGFISSMQFHSPGAYTSTHARTQKHEMSARRRGGHYAPTSGVTVRRAGDKQSVSPAIESCVSGRHSTAAARSGPARLSKVSAAAAFYSVYPEMATVLPPLGRASSATTTAARQQHSYYPRRISPPTALFTAAHSSLLASKPLARCV